MSCLENVTGIDPHKRLASMRAIAEHCDWTVARDMESIAHAWSSTRTNYEDKILQLVVNLRQNPRLVEQYGTAVVALDDATMAKGTIIEDIERETERRRTNFEAIVQEKYNLVNKDSYRSTLKCGRCGSGESLFE